MTEDKTCAQLVASQWALRRDELKLAWAAFGLGADRIKALEELRARKTLHDDSRAPDEGTAASIIWKADGYYLGKEVAGLDSASTLCFANLATLKGMGGAEAIYEYGLGFDYVAYADVADGGNFFRWQLSWEDASDEIQFYPTSDNQLRAAQYRYVSGVDSATIQLDGDDFDLMEGFFAWHKDAGVVDSLIAEAMYDGFE